MRVYTLIIDGRAIAHFENRIDAELVAGLLPIQAQKRVVDDTISTEGDPVFFKKKATAALVELLLTLRSHSEQPTSLEELSHPPAGLLRRLANAFRLAKD